MSFPTQRQAVPGEQDRMTPVPDCGEDSYRGSGKLTGKKAVITGGTAASAALSRSPMREKAPTF